MRILITPEANTAETAGSITRTLAVASEAQKRGHEVAFCAGNDINIRGMDTMKNYHSEIPSPIGAPKLLGRPLYKLYKGLGLQGVESVDDYETIFHFIGLSSRRFFVNDIQNVQRAIKEYKPDILFTEHRLSPLVAARLEKVKSLTTYSLPIHQSFTNANYGKYSKGVRAHIDELGLGKVASILDLYNWADAKIVPSSRELEPIQSEKLYYVGPLIDYSKIKKQTGLKKNILVYLGNSGFTNAQIISAIRKAFANSKWDVYITSKEMSSRKIGNIAIAPYFDFSELLSEALVLISHGGQNSMMQSLLNGVPMVSFPGGVGERRFNAFALEKLKAGKMFENRDFNPATLRAFIGELDGENEYAKNAAEIGKSLKGLGGAGEVISIMEKML